MPERRNLRRNEDAMGVRFQDLMLAKGIELRTGRARRSTVALARCVERFQHRSERLALVGQDILVARRMAFIKPRADHAGVLQALETRRQRVRRYAAY
jgi:hypothetical protein